MVKTVLIMLLLTLTLFGCKDNSTMKAVETSKIPASSSSITEVSHNLIKRYNQLLSEGYKTTNMTKLQEVATDRKSVV